jgi:hypothetical protein
MDNPKDSKYVVYRTGKFQGEELKQFLLSHLIIYCKLDQDTQTQKIDFVALTKSDDAALRRSATV